MKLLKKIFDFLREKLGHGEDEKVHLLPVPTAQNLIPRFKIDRKL